MELPLLQDSHRVLNIHRDVPGVLSRINGLVAAMGANINSQYLKTRNGVGYLIMDVERSLSRAVKKRSRRSTPTSAPAFSFKRFKAVQNLPTVSSQAEHFIRGAALLFLEQLGPEARLWIFQYNDGLRPLTPAEAPAEVQVAVERGLAWSRAEESAARARR